MSLGEGARPISTVVSIPKSGRRSSLGKIETIDTLLACQIWGQGRALEGADKSASMTETGDHWDLVL